MSDLVDTLAWLVGIPSPTGHEQEIQRAIAARFDGASAGPITIKKLKLEV